MTDKLPQQLASQKFHAKRSALGWRKVTVWLDAETLAKLEAIRAVEGSLDKAIAYALMMSPTRDQVDRAEEL